MDCQNANPIDVSIAVICYNQEKVIAEVLESVRYQLENYQTNDRIQLIVADDASNDRTRQVIEKWIEKNRTLFAEVCTLFAEKNQGTNANLCGAVKKAKGKYLITIAGDDLFSNADVIKHYKENPSNGISACAPYCFENGRVITDAEYYKNVITSYYFPAWYVKERSKYACPVINGAIVGRDFFCDEAVIFAKRVKLLDDQAKFMKAMEVINDIEYSFTTEPVLLYRISSGQVTRKPEYQAQAIEDKKILAEYAGKHTRNLLTRYAIFCEYMRLKNRKLYKAFFRFFNLDNFYVKAIYWKHFLEIKSNIEDLLQPKRVENVNQYIKMIQKSAEQYLKE